MLPLLIQLQNLALLAALAWTSQRYIEMRLPDRIPKTWMSVPWIVIAITYQPWILNAFMPLGDHLFALMSMGALVLFLEADRSPESRTAKLLAYCGYSITAIAVIQKSTAIGLLVYALILFLRRSHPLKRTLLPGGAIIVSMLILYAQLHTQVLATGAGHYLADQTLQMVIADTATNLIFVALPSQIIPNFNYLLTRDFTSTHAYLASSLAPSHLPWLALGLFVSSAVGFGAWIARTRLAPELAMLAVVMPLYALASNSTSRYLASIQPVFWVLILPFLNIAPSFVARYRRWIIFVITGAFFFIAIQIAINITRSFTSSQTTSYNVLPYFLHELSSTFETGQIELTKIIRDRPDLRIVPTNDDYRWAVLAGAKYIAVEHAGNAACNGTMLLTTVTCDARNCARQIARHTQQTKQLWDQGLKSEMLINIENRAATFRIERWYVKNRVTCMSQP